MFVVSAGYEQRSPRHPNQCCKMPDVVSIVCDLSGGHTSALCLSVTVGWHDDHEVAREDIDGRNCAMNSDSCYSSNIACRVQRRRCCLRKCSLVANDRRLSSDSALGPSCWYKALHRLDHQWRSSPGRGLHLLRKCSLTRRALRKSDVSLGFVVRHGPSL